MIFSKNDYSLLCCYYDLLHGATDNELKYTLSKTEIDLLHKFHTRAVAGAQFSNLLPPEKRNKPLRTAMFQMFECWQRGKTIPEPESFHTRKELTLAFSARLNGATDNELRAMGFIDDDIDILDNFIFYVDHDMTVRDRMRKTGVGEHSARAMMKIYQERQARLYELRLAGWTDDDLRLWKNATDNDIRILNAFEESRERHPSYQAKKIGVSRDAIDKLRYVQRGRVSSTRWKQRILES